MRPDDQDFDDELRGHLALSVKERVERGEDPEKARKAALKELGYMPEIRDSMHRVWYSRWFDAVTALGRDMRIGLRSLWRSKGMAATVVVTLALGIGANTAIFTVLKEVLLKPLVNRDESRLIYVRQGAPGLQADNITLSMPEIRDLIAGSKTVAKFGDFSTSDFTLVGMGDARTVKAGLVNGSYFEVMGLKPVLGRLIGPEDDGPQAAGAVVLTFRTWSTALARDPSIVGKTIRLDSRNAVVVGVLEPSVPYPTETELFANIVVSPHHMGATMVDERTHRMTELFGRLAPGATLEEARAELTARHAAMMGAHAGDYPASARTQISVTRLRDQIAAPARTLLVLLLATAGVVFLIACSNVANLILARSVRREGELALRASLGASAGALRRTLLAESLVLCGAGAAVGVLLAFPLVAWMSRYAARFSVRALEATVDGSVLAMGGGLALFAAVALAYVPRLPSQRAPRAADRERGGARSTGRNGGLRAFAVTQIALSFVLLAGAAMLVNALTAMQAAPTNFELGQVLAFDVPTPPVDGADADRVVGTFQEVTRRVRELPGVNHVAIGSIVPWRDAGRFGPGFRFTGEGYVAASGEEDPHARMRIVAGGFFAALGVPLLAGRDFNDDDRRGQEPVVIVSQSVAQRVFPNGDAVNRRMKWTDPIVGSEWRRIVGVVPDIDDENVVPGPALAVYNPWAQVVYGGRLFVHASGDPYALVGPVSKIVRELAPLQPVERAATLADVRAEVLAPERLSAFVFSGFAGIALLISIVGVAGVLAFSVSARRREFGVRLAIGATPGQLLRLVLAQGTALVTIGVTAGLVAGGVLAWVASRQFEGVRLPGALPVLAAVVVLSGAALLASLLPAVSAARVDVQKVLRPE
jgi:putative ABC transport system permease protein